MNGLASLFKKAMPYALLIFLMGLLLRGDALFLKIWGANGNWEVAQYAYGYRFTDAFNSFCFLLSGLLFPFFCKHINEKKLIRKTAHASIGILAVISIFSFTVFIIFQENLTRWIYHTNSESVQKILLYCIFSFAGLSLVHVYGSLLTAARKIKTLNSTTLFFCCVSGICNDYFIPRYGAVASAFICCTVQFLYGSALALFCYINPLRLLQNKSIKHGNV
jgi:O-antigen/teichoic acid export membrane protein